MTEIERLTATRDAYAARVAYSAARDALDAARDNYAAARDTYVAALRDAAISAQPKEQTDD